MQHIWMVPSVQSLSPETLRRICDILIFSDRPPVNSSSNETQVKDRTRSRYAGMQTVVSLARTSRRLHEHAADALWHTIPAFGVLAFTLPQDMWSCTRTGEYMSTGVLFEVSLDLKRPLSEADLVRFHHYAPRVKRISMLERFSRFKPCTPSLTFSPNILDAFESYPIVLPNLRALWSSPDLEHHREFYRSFPILFGPNLEEVVTWCPDDDPTVPQLDEGHYKCMLIKLHAIAPNLQCLVLNVDRHPFAEACAPILSSLTSNTSENLTFLYVGHMALNSYAIHHLAGLPFLTYLNAKLGDRITAADLSFLRAPSLRYFPMLQNVHLVHSHDLSLLSLFVQHIRATPLKTIHLVLDTAVPFQHVTDFLNSVLKRKRADTLEALTLDCWVRRDFDSPGPHVLTEEHLRPFFAFRRLKCFDLNVRCDFEIDNTTLDNIAAAWPDLKVLGLGPSHETTTSKVTLAGLIPLARGCPRLQKLGLTIDAATPMEQSIDLNGPYGSLLLHGPTVNIDFSLLPDPKTITPKYFLEKPLDDSPLEELRLGRSPIADPPAVAGFLSCFFPNLRQVDGQWRPIELLENGARGHTQRDWSEEEVEEIVAEAEHRATWNWVVDQALPELMAIRRAEQRRARRPASVAASKLRDLVQMMAELSLQD